MQVAAERLIRSVNRFLRRNRAYSIGGVDVRLTPDHLLPIHRLQNPLYDQFLPYLAGRLTARDAIIDVGANCGDTLAGMVSGNDKANYLCIEADGGFYSLLIENVQAIRRCRPGLRIACVQALVGTSQTAGTLVGKGGTMTLVKGAGVQSQSLEDLVESLQFEPDSSDNVLLIKCDVDGFDYDVIRSAGTLLKREKTMLFFECHCTEAFQTSAYSALFRELFSLGFSDAWVFDNYGNPLFHATRAENLVELVNYLWRQHSGTAHRTFSYVDILICRSACVGIASAAVAGFEASVAG